jgi:hypothetical protein
MVERIIRSIMLSRALVPEFVDAFASLTESQLDALLQSFKFEHCIVREPLAKTLRTQPVTSDAV